METSWVIHFTDGWRSVANALALVGGGLAAIIVHIAALALVMMFSIMVINAVFNCVTNALVKRWEKTGRRPSARWAQIIAEEREKRSG